MVFVFACEAVPVGLQQLRHRRRRRDRRRSCDAAAAEICDAARHNGGMQLVRPAAEYLPSYRAALERGWSPNTVNPAAGWLELDRIHADPVAFLNAQDDPHGKGEPITLPDGSVVPRLPGYRRWIWDGELAGVVSLRWQPGSAALPEHVLGHVGYTVVPWKRGRGYATDRRATGSAAGGRRAWPASCRTVHRRWQPGLTTRDHGQWRSTGRTLQQAGGVRSRQLRTSLAHHPRPVAKRHPVAERFPARKPHTSAPHNPVNGSLYGDLVTSVLAVITEGWEWT